MGAERPRVKFRRPTQPFRWDRDLRGRSHKYLNVLPSAKACGTGAGEAEGDDECSSMPYADSGTGERLESTPERLGKLLLLWLPAWRLVGD
jgi:hypothetical protein